MSLPTSAGIAVAIAVLALTSAVRPLESQQQTTVHVPASVLERYVGRYDYVPGQMKRTDLFIVVRLEGDTLIRQMSTGPEVVLTPISETRFKVGTTSLETEFVADPAGGVTQVMGWGYQQMTAYREPTDWPQWRGPTRDGAVHAALPTRWPEALKKRWQTPVGAGHASPVVSGDRVVAIARQGDQEIVRALDVVSGNEIWRASYPAPYIVNPAAWAHGPGPKSTPAIAGGRVFTLGIGGILSAFDLATGTLIWRRPAPAVPPLYGTATSPLVDGSSVIAHVGGDGNGALTSFDAATGKPRWQWTGDGPGYGSPIIATLGGVRQVIAQTQKHVVGVNASNGTLLWRLPLTTDFDQNAFTPLVFQDLLINAGPDEPLTAIRPKLDGGKWIAETVWTNPQTPMFMSSPVLVGGTIYGLTVRGRGQFVAIDAATGKTLWHTQGREGENASMLGSRSWLLASTTDGNLIVARANPQKYEEVRRYQIAESALWSHPAITDRSIVVKDADTVICWTF